MTVASKLIQEAANGGITNLPRSRALLGMCTISTGTSVLLLLRLYKKSQKLRNSTQLKRKVPETLSQNGSQETTKKKQINRKFLSQLLRILKILIPRWTAPEVGYMGLISSMLIVRSLCDLWTIYLGTQLESSIISGEKSRFNGHLLEFAMTMPLMSLTNAILKYSTRQLEIRFRSRLTNHLMKKYMYNLTFYKLNQQLRNVDQLMTTDVEKFASTVANLYSQLSKPLLDILIYVYGISRSVGASVPGIMLSYLAIAAALISQLRRPMARLTSKEQELEGDYRFGSTRIITNSEEISFYKGGQRELGWILNNFSSLYQHLDSFTAFKFMTEFFENFVAKYIATVVGYYAVGRPFFIGDNRSFSQRDLQNRQETYYKSGRMLVNLSLAIGRFVLNGKEVSKLAGYTTRVHHLIETLNKLNKEEDGRLKNAGQLIGRGQVGIGRYVIQDHVIKFEDVPIITPNGDVLLKGLSMEVRSGMNVLVCGPNGCGKSSLFRILGELWPLHGGVLTKPATEKLFYVPQKPYMPYGTFRDQIIYPDSLADMKRKGITDSELVKFLKLVHLESMIFTSNGNGNYNLDRDEVKLNGGKETVETTFEEIWKTESDNVAGVVKVGATTENTEESRTLGQRSWDSEENWMDVLSGGEKQRLAMARLFYHKPQFAILDECTSAVSADVEGIIYRYCRSAGITLFTVTHRKSLWDYHERVLHMDGRGGYSFKNIDHSVDEAFGS